MYSVSQYGSIIAQKACARQHNPRELPCQTRSQRDQTLDWNLAKNVRFIPGRRDATKKNISAWITGISWANRCTAVFVSHKYSWRSS